MKPNAKSKISKTPKIISHLDFIQAVTMDPNWAAKLTEPVIVNGRIQLVGCELHCLSPLLTFADRVSLDSSPYLKRAVGTFMNGVSFNDSGIEIIDPQFTVHKRTDANQLGVDFERTQIKVATGNYPQSVDFSYCPIETIENLTAESAVFYNVKTLKRVPLEYLENPNFHFDRPVKARLLAEHEARRKMDQAREKTRIEL